jgi:hypothetical protein
VTRKRDTKSPASVLHLLRNACVDGQSVQNAQVLFVLERRTFGRIPVIHAGGTKSGSSLFRVGRECSPTPNSDGPFLSMNVTSPRRPPHKKCSPCNCEFRASLKISRRRCKTSLYQLPRRQIGFKKSLSPGCPVAKVPEISVQDNRKTRRSGKSPAIRIRNCERRPKR